ncbi:MAG: translation initiation factor eIF-1A [Candidatus Diapherotrites archaeon]
MKERPKTEAELVSRLRLPNKKEGELFGLAIQLHGSDQIRVACDDGVERMCRIPGKLRKRVWVRVGDVVIIKKWDIQPIKADIKWLYYGTQVERLKREGHLKGLPL